MNEANSKTNLLVMAIILAILLWLVGGFLVSKWLGMIFVIIGITIVSLAAGNVMNSLAPPEHK